jgi:hypothetical protein
MVDPASTADWTLALLIAAALGGLTATCAWALRQENLDHDIEPPCHPASRSTWLAAPQRGGQ